MQKTEHTIILQNIGVVLLFILHPPVPLSSERYRPLNAESYLLYVNIDQTNAMIRKSVCKTVFFEREEFQKIQLL